MNPQTKAEFEKLLCKPGNKTCIDCDTFNPQWASVNNGCFMCIKCAGNHRSMGVHITFVRSVTMDSWSKIQLARIKNGGNNKLKQFWSKQKFPKHLTPKQRLNNTAMDKYRENLLSAAKGENIKEIPFIGYKSREIANKSLSNLSARSASSSSLSSASSSHSNLKMQGFGNTNYDPNDPNSKANNNNNNDTWSDFGNWASSFAAKTTAVASDLAQKSKTAAVTIGSKASEKATNIKTKLGDEEYQANLKKNAAETWNKTTNTLSSWWSTAATSVTNVINENLGDMSQQNGAPKLYHIDNNEEKIDNNNNNKNNNNNQSIQRKKMAALSSEQYFNKDKESKNKMNSYGTTTGHNINNKDNVIKREEDILGLNNDIKQQEKHKKHIDEIPAPFPNKKNNKNIMIEDDFDEWGFGDDEDEDEDINKNKNKKPNIKPVIDINDVINGNKNDQKKQVESLLDFDNNENQKKNDLDPLLNFDDNGDNKKDKNGAKDGNSSDELDAFFNEMANDSGDDKKNSNKKESTSNLNNNDITDLLGSHDANNNDKNNNNNADDWGW